MGYVMDIIGWALGIGLAAGYIIGYIEGRRCTTAAVLEEAKKINKPD